MVVGSSPTVSIFRTYNSVVEDASANECDNAMSWVRIPVGPLLLGKGEKNRRKKDMFETKKGKLINESVYQEDRFEYRGYPCVIYSWIWVTDAGM